MSTTVFPANALCQALIFEGVSPMAEANIESYLRHLWGHNGPEFVLARLKLLKEETER